MLMFMNDTLERLATMLSVRCWEELRLVAHTYILMCVELALYIRIRPAIFDLRLSRYIFCRPICEELLKVTVECRQCDCASSGFTPCGYEQWLKLSFRADTGAPYVLFFPKIFAACRVRLRFNLLKPSGFFTYHQAEHSKILHGARFALIVLYGYQNKQRLFPYTLLTVWLL